MAPVCAYTAERDDALAAVTVMQKVEGYDPDHVEGVSKREPFLTAMAIVLNVTLLLGEQARACLLGHDHDADSTP